MLHYLRGMDAPAIRERIRFKLALLMYGAVTCILISSVKGRSSFSSVSAVVPETRLVFVQRSFTLAGPFL